MICPYGSPAGQHRHRHHADRLADNNAPLYHHRTTEISQRATPSTATVTIAPARDVNGEGPFPGAVTTRSGVVELVVENAEASAVDLDGVPLPEHNSPEAFAAAASGWFNAGRNLVVAKSPPADVYGAARTFAFDLRPIAPKTSVNFVCDRGFTFRGESVYAVGSLPELGAWDVDRAVRLELNVYYDYIVTPPPAHRGPGPSAPVWTGVVSELPPDAAFEWKCIRKREDGSGEPVWQLRENNRHRTTASGYSGQTYGSF